jgi:DNA-binding PadR family transcriptional regulator
MTKCRVVQSKDHATNGRFKGKHMSMGAKGQAKVQEVVTKRLDLDNIDRVSTASSSNRCENMYSVLSKWTHGKRNYHGRTDSWECNQLYVAITINNDDADEIEDKIRKLTGAHFSPSLREEGKATRKKRKIYHRNNKRKEEVKKRRAAAKIISTRNAVKNSKAPARHKSDKLSPKDDCKSNKEKKKPAKPAVAKKEEDKVC